MTENNKQTQQPVQIAQQPAQIVPEPVLIVEPDRGNERYAAYIARVRQIKIVLFKSALRAKRYLAYSSDLGESVRPLVQPKWVTAAYGLAWTYILGDCGYRGYLEVKSGETNLVGGRTFLQEFLFQAIASMALPSIIIHTAVAQSEKIFLKKSMARTIGIKGIKYGPSVIGISLIPLMPILDPPVEHLCEKVFDRYWPIERKNLKSHH